MKLKLKFKSADEFIEKEVVVDAFTLMSLLNDKAVIAIAKQIDDGIYSDFGYYLCSISDND